MVANGHDGDVRGIPEDVAKRGSHGEVGFGICAVAGDDENGAAGRGVEWCGSGEEKGIDGFDGGDVEGRRGDSFGERGCYEGAEGGFRWVRVERGGEERGWRDEGLQHHSGRRRAEQAKGKIKGRAGREGVHKWGKNGIEVEYMRCAADTQI